MNITPLGDSALVVRVRAQFNDDPEGSLREVAQVLTRLHAAELPGVREMAPAFTTIGVFYNPAQVAAAGAPADQVFEWLAERIRQVLAQKAAKGGNRLSRRVLEIPVCYDEEFAPDVSAVAESSGLSVAEVIRRHVGAKYRVACVGFVPGFAFLSGLPPALAMPRRATPRTQVPAGSVAIGGAQTGIYPQQTPGGWNIIGRTPRRLFDPTRATPALLAAGDTVRFRRITRLQFATFSE